jgi:hypothetical protein
MKFSDGVEVNAQLQSSDVNVHAARCNARLPYEALPKQLSQWSSRIECS